MFLRLKAVEAVMTRYQQREAIMTHMHSLFLAADVLTNALDSRKSLVREVLSLSFSQCVLFSCFTFFYFCIDGVISSLLYCFL